MNYIKEVWMLLNVCVQLLVILNVQTLTIYGIDKWKAKKHWWRIPEEDLMFDI